MGQDRLQLKIDTVNAEHIAQKAASEVRLPHQPLTGLSYVSEASSYLENVRVQMSTFELRCNYDCLCICHRLQKRRIPRALHHVLGILFVGYAGIPYITPACDTRRCVRRSPPTTTFTYFFPSWLLARAIVILLKVTPICGPELILRFPRIVNASSPVFIHTSHDNEAGVRELLQQGLASTCDVMCVTGNTLLQVRFRVLSA